MPKKLEFEIFLDRELYKEDIVAIAEKHGLSTKGNKVDIIRMLLSEASPEELLSELFLLGDLQEILEDRGLPKSGNKDELVKRVLSFVDTPLAKPEKKKAEKAVKPKKASLENDIKEIKEIIEKIELQGTGKTKETDYEKQLVVGLQLALGKERVTYEKAVGRSRLDIVVDSANNKQIGIELKLYAGTTSIDRLFGQVDRYLGSVYDKIIAVVITKKSLASARDEAKRLKKLKNVDVIVKAG